MSRRLASGLLCAVLWLQPVAGVRAYEAGTTHAGLTAEAVLASGLHRFLRQRLGLALGLFSRLQLRPGQMKRHEQYLLQQKLARLDRAGGYIPDADGGLYPAQWVMAGSVLAEVPASLNRHHFLDPSTGKGLNNPAALQGWLVSLLSVLDGSDTAREFFTGTGFHLTGMSALEWIEHERNPLSLRVFRRHLRQAVTGDDPGRRQHHLAWALMALGGVLHVLQDMASPTHVRNDFLEGHLQRLGGSNLLRGSLYEHYVALRFGQQGIPSYDGPPIVRPSVRAFFSTRAWDGLADRTALSHFSPGTLPPPVVVLPGASREEVRQRVNARLPLRKPEVGKLDLKCARAGRSCYLRGGHGPLLAYSLDRRSNLRFHIDRRCREATAEHLLPLAVGYSTGLIDHLLRGRIELSWEDDSLTLVNAGVPLRKARAQVLAEDLKGRREPLKADWELRPDSAGSQPLGSARLELPPGTRALVVLLEGADRSGEPVISAARLVLAPQQGAPASQPTGPGLFQLKLPPAPSSRPDGD